MFETSKFYLFGDRFLSEGMIVPWYVFWIRNTEFCNVNFVTKNWLENILDRRF